MSESIQHKLDRVRPPRVQITYDVQIGDAFEVKELPLVVGVMSDLSGQLPEGTEPVRLRDRQFVEIDRDSFKDIFAKINPRSSFTVDNLMRVREQGAAEVPKLPVEISAQATLDNSKPLDSLLVKLQGEDPLYMFHPLWVIRQTPELNTLYEARGRLSDLLSKLDGNDRLAAELKAAVNSADKPADLALSPASYPHTNGAKQLATSPDDAAKSAEKSTEKLTAPVDEATKTPEKPAT